MNNLKISVVVICRNEQSYIKECLESLANQDYPNFLFEVIIIENCSTDKTAEIVQAFIAGKQNMRLIISNVCGIAVNRNKGVHNANHDHIAFLDADCTAEINWLSSLDIGFREESETDNRIAALGGPNLLPLHPNFFRKAVSIALSNFWGNSGSLQGAIFSTHRRVVEHIPTLNVLYDRKKLIEVGCFDERTGNCGEDLDISHRLRWKGFKLIYDVKAKVRHQWRTSFMSWANTMKAYGKATILLVKKDHRFMKVKYLAPQMILISLLSCGFVYVNTLMAIPFTIYLLLTLTIAIYECFRQRRLKYIGHVFFIYIITHIFYAIGQLEALIVKR